jgi:hypothetical protein
MTWELTETNHKPSNDKLRTIHENTRSDAPLVRDISCVFVDSSYGFFCFPAFSIKVEYLGQSIRLARYRGFGDFD